jgi:hypothetical protein
MRYCGFVYVGERRDPQAIADSWSNRLYGKAYTARIPWVKARRVFVAGFIDAVCQKRPAGMVIPWQKDDPEQVADFFRRWHKETRDHYCHV